MHEIVMPLGELPAAYPLHQLVYSEFAEPDGTRRFVYAPVGGEGWVGVLVRGKLKPKHLPFASPVQIPQSGSVWAFALRAMADKCDRNGKPVPIPLSMPHLRFRWLRNRQERNGFELIDFDFTREVMWIEKPKRKPFWIDVTNYAGVLRVSDTEKFGRAMQGIGDGRAFGCGLLILNPLH